MEHEALGADDVTDLVLVNIKGPDYAGHALRARLGGDARRRSRSSTCSWRAMLGCSTEGRAAASSVVAITADHGMPGEPAPGRRYYTDKISAA